MRRLTLALFLALISAVPAQEPAVQLLLPSRTLEAKSTFEVRFAPEMVAPEKIGQQAGVSPMVFDPPVAGRFVWLSTRSGSFTPTGVLPLGTKYTITLARVLKDARGKEFSGKLRETAETPPMRVKGAAIIGSRDPENASSVPRFLVLFNANVKAGAAAKFFRFEDGARTRIPARVEAADEGKSPEMGFPRWESDDRSLSPWAVEQEQEEEKEEEIAAVGKTHARGNVLFVTPVRPLPPGTDWRLVVETGLPAAEWKTALPVAKQVPIGTVQAFAASEISAEGDRSAGRRVLIEFSKALADEVSSENISRWIKIQPVPPNLKISAADTTVTLRGDFALGVRYRVSVASGLPAAEPTVTGAPVTKDVFFEKYEARLYFQDFAAHQYAGGTRRHRLLSINIPRVRVSARLFTGASVPAATKAYDEYQKGDEEEPDESYARIDVDSLPGQLIWEKELAPGGPDDTEQVVPLDWNEIVGQNRGGVVLLTAESIDSIRPDEKRVGTQTLIQLTDLGAIWKDDREGTFLHVFSLADGKGLPRVRCQLINDQLAQLWQGATDERGQARLPEVEEARWVFLETEKDAHLVALNSGENSLPLYQLGVNSEESYDEEGDGRYAKTIFLFTERGVYRPGDKLHLKGYAQDRRPDQPLVPAGKQVTITVNDAKEREIFTNQVTLSEFGSFAQDITLPDGSLGRYTIVATGVEGERLGGSAYFQVQEYKPNAFEILLPAPPVTTGNTQLALPVTAKYFMGKPLSKAKLTWSLVARDENFAPEGLSAFVFCNGIYDYRLNRTLDKLSRFDAQGDAVLAEDGTAQIATALPINPKSPQPRATKLLCEITDINQQTVSESRAFVQHASEFYFGLRRFDSVLKEGAPLPIELIAVQPDGKPLGESTRATLRLSRINWQTNRLATAGYTSQFESQAQMEVVWERALATVPGLGDDRKPNHAQLEQVVAGKAGEYLLEAIGRDGKGHDVLTSVVFEISGETEMDWNYRNPYVVDLVADKESYDPGQTATLLVKTPISGEALVTVERDRVLRSFVVPLTGNAPSVQVPIAETDGPNVFVSVMLLRGANDSPRKIKAPEYRIGYANLKVARPKNKLAIELRPAAPALRPGEKVLLDAEVRDWQGKAAAGAELTLFAVDEGVLSLTGYETPDPLGFFNRPRGLGVSTSLTLPALLNEELDTSDFANKGYLIGDGKGGPALLDGLRKNFLATAFWNATLRTDAQGRARAEFPAPDSLTRYRVIAVAVTKEAQFGTTQSAFEINKPIMIESAMPAFANVGDKLMLRAVVHNTTGGGGKAEVELKIDGTARAPETKREIDLPSGASVPVDFPVELVSEGAATWRWDVHFASADGNVSLGDAVQAAIKVNHPAPVIRQVHTSRVEAERAEVLRISDPQIIEGTGLVAVNSSNTRVGELRESLRYLLHYPYGCVEQTTSSLLPWLEVRDLRQTLPEIGKSDEEIAKAVNSGIRRLLTMQASGGGLSYWPGGREPMLWGSAYGGLALSLAKKQGFEVPETEHKRILNYVSEQLRGTAKDATGYGLSDRCLAVYSLAVAGVAEPAYHDLLFQKRARLSAEDRALVALAIIESKGPKQMIDELLRGPAVTDDYFEQWFGSVARQNAIHLLAWTQHEPRAPRVDELATELFARRSNGHWHTTQGNVWSLIALSSYLRNVETGPRQSNGAVTWGEKMNRFSLPAETAGSTTEFAIDPASVREPVTIAKSGGTVFAEVTVAARSRLIEQPRQDQGFAVTRRYAKIGDDGRLSPATDLRVGDRVLITLDIEARRRATYVALQDPLPSVLAPINPAFKSQETLAGEALGYDWVSDYSELREDRALFFVDLLNPGKHTLRYLARVVTAGEAIAPVAKVEEMYHPERFGTTETVRVTASSLQ